MSIFYRITIGARAVMATGMSRISSSPSVTRTLQKQMVRSCSYSVTKAKRDVGQSMRLSQEDTIRRQLIAASSATDLLDLVVQHRKSMNSNHLVAAFEILDCKVDAGDVLPSTVTETSGFKQLTDQTLRRIRFFDTGQCLTLLKAASTLKLPAESAFVMGICEMIRTTVSEISIPQLMFLNFLIARFEQPNFIMMAIRIAIPLIFRARCPAELDARNTDDCFKKLIFALYVGCDKGTVDLLCRALTNRGFDLSFSNATKLMKALFVAKEKHNRMNRFYFEMPAFKALIDQCMELTAERITSFNDEAGRSFLYCVREMKMPPRAYHALWSRVINEKWSLDSISELIRPYCLQNYFTIEYAEYVRNLIVDQEISVLNEDVSHLRDLSRIMALLAMHTSRLGDTHSPSPRTLLDYDIETQTALKTLAAAAGNASQDVASAKLFIALLRNLALAGVFPREPLELLFSKAFNTRHLEELPLTVLAQVFEIEQFARIHFGEETSSRYYRMAPWLREKVTAYLARLPIHNENIRRDLVTLLGGEEYFATNVFSPLGARINFMVVAGPDDEFVPFNNLPLDTKEFFASLPGNHKVVSILGADEHSFCQESSMLALHKVVQKELLRLQNLNPICINISEWEQMLDQGKRAWITEKLQKMVREARPYTDSTWNTTPTSYAE